MLTGKSANVNEKSLIVGVVAFPYRRVPSGMFNAPQASLLEPEFTQSDRWTFALALRDGTGSCIGG